ncbi:bifunctional helix-turn-helix transcriptional regulator/GNAT family N-acetyltransferase [Streptomyces sp900129855]|uniref:Bifunctional helix-turn-helix transcriptional regulator/GNAT family N-acetyltransferase n=1 Tax=Streptomyces sp. 900129855 TaxID=3155129 RepID=A0ABV2ZB20_9ACTN
MTGQTVQTVQEFRAFNRFYTNVIGALDYGRHLYAPYNLTESRVLYELAHAPRTDAADLRAALSLDSGYLSRILNRFEQDGLVERVPSEEDSRRRRVVLTERGREAAGLLDERAQDSTGTLLESVAPADRARLSEAMRTIRHLLGEQRGEQPPEAQEVLLREPEPGDLGWIVQRNAALYTAEYGFDADYEGLVARIVADFAQNHDPRRERVWIAELAGRAVGCVMCVRDEAPGTARLRLLLVEPDARGHGIGDRLVGAVVAFAREAGYDDIVLWTNDILSTARHIYRRHGFTLTAERPHHSFGKDLVGQDWRLDLRRVGSEA